MTLRGGMIVVALALVLWACGDSESDGAAEMPLGAGPYPVADVRVEVTHPERVLNYRISCQGDTASLTGDDVDVSADRACSALSDAAVEEFLVNGPQENRVCTEIYGGPDVASVSGMINGEEVDVVIDRANGCGIDDWDVVLDGVLPVPAGAAATAEPNDEAGDEEGAGDIVRLWVKPERVDCVGVAPQQCLQIARSEDGEYELFYDRIEGFDFDEGTSYVIEVEVSEVDASPADASSFSYRLLQVIEQS